MIGGVLVAATVAATAMAGVAVVQRRNAEGAGTLAEARRLGTQALVVDGYDQALLLAVEGRHLDDSRETRANLLETIERSPGAVGVIRDPSFGFVDVAVTPDGTSLLASSAGDPDGVIVFDVATGQRRTSAPTPTHPVHVALSADGRLAVHTDTTGANNTPEFRYLLRQFDPTTLESLGPPLAGLGPDVAPTRLSISPDNRLVGAVTDIELEGRTAPPPEALVWDTAQGGEPVLRFAFDGTSGRDMVLMPDSKTMLVAGARRYDRGRHRDGACCPSHRGCLRADRPQPGRHHAGRHREPRDGGHDRVVRHRHRRAARRPSPATVNASPAWSSAPAAPPWPRVVTTASSWCGMSRPASGERSSAVTPPR